MKIENKFAYIIIFFIIVNLIYYKIAKDIQKENLKIINNSISSNNQNQPSENFTLIANEENLKVEFNNELSVIDEDYSENDNENVSTSLDLLSNSKKYLSYKDNDEIIAEIGHIVNDGLIPIPIPQTNKILTAELYTRYSYELGANPLLNNSDTEPRNSHLISFLIILGILIFISLVLVAMQEFQRITEFDLFNVNSNKFDGYYLLSDRI